MKKSALESSFELIARSIIDIPKPTREYRFHPTRQFRFDFAWPVQKRAVEIEGGIWVMGGHTRGKHFISDCDKYNLAVLMGWKVLRFTGDHLKKRTDEVIALVRELFKDS